GASALLAAPAGSLTVTDLQETTDALLSSGVPIGGINAVRKHLSAVKGGRLAREAAPATVCGLVLSDVVGNDLSTIGSGPTVPDETTFADALGVLDRYDVAVPEAVREHLDAETGGETPDASDPAFDRVDHHLIADNMTALEGAADAAEAAGYEPLVLTSRLRGEASEVGTTLVSMGAEAAATGTPVEPPAVLLAGGECTVSIDGAGGSGGPNQELALSAALEGEPIVLAAVDTDGEDGSSDAAGAIVDGSTVSDGDRERAADRLSANDTGTYLAEVGATVETGPTGTNVNDVVVMVVGERSS
ncbi:hydroxypyruvate reductase, partial [Halosimplex carlsbadense 2-9-1]